MRFPRLARLIACLPPLLLAAVPAPGTAAEPALEPCLACHGADAPAQPVPTPLLGGQPSFFIITQLFLFREGRRANEQMIEVAKAMSDADLRAYAGAVARLPPPAPPEGGRDPARYARGEALAGQHKCNVCHGADLAGQQQVPRLANQRESYLLKALREFKSGTRKGYGGAMAVELQPLDDDGLVDLAHYLAHLSR